MAELRRVYSDLVRYETELWDAIDRLLRENLDMSMGNFDVLQTIARTPDCRVYDIARALVITVGGTSKAVDRIEARGHAVRRSNPDDKRSSIIALTPAGEELLAKATTLVDDELHRRIGAVLAPAELDQLAHTLTRLRTTHQGAAPTDAGV
jgi:DNA-binding MarR family transcriptional regulator